MGSIYTRHNSLWLKYKNAEGSWEYKPSGLKKGQERDAKLLLKKIENLVASGEHVPHQGPLTVRRWSVLWLESRRARDLVIADDYASRLENHILPSIGDMKLDDVLPVHIEELIKGLRQKKLAPRTVRHIYFQTHGMFERAVRRGHILVNPCNLDEDDLPAKVDKNPEWRATAIYTRDEVEQILTDGRIPHDRRIYDSLLFLAGIRFGEASALRWRHYDPKAEPLGRLAIARSYSTKLKVEKDVKTKVPRAVPVHAVLATLLADWKLSGWPRMMGRTPGPDDLLIPSRLGKNRSSNHMLKKFHQDMVRLGLRLRRQHDLRRTFISLCLGDGASKDILRWITHAPEGDVMDDYTTLVWKPLCREVAKLEIRLRDRESGAIANAVNSHEPAITRVTGRVTGVNSGQRFQAEAAGIVESLTRTGWRGGRDLNPRPPA
jgi:integrase